MPLFDLRVLPLLVFLLLAAWPLILYPALMLLAGRLRRPAAPVANPAEWPRAALVICALNEARVIGAKLDNTLALDYPPGRLRVVVVSDGSTDATAAIVRGYRERGVQLIDQPARRGKLTNLNEVIPACPEEFVVLSDANVMYDAAAIRRLMARFTDARVGCVSGKVIITNTTPELSQGEGSYYSVEWMLQEQASRLYSMVGADGAMYALRRALYEPCPAGTLIEDLVIPLSIVGRGYRAVMEPGAVGWEEGPSSPAEEFKRKVRIAAGASQALMHGTGWPRRGAPLRFWFVFVSHKLLRWLIPVNLAGALAAAALTWAHPLSQLVLAGFGLMALLALVRWASGVRWTLFDAPYYFLFGQMAVAVGLWRGIAGTQSVLWEKVNR